MDKSTFNQHLKYMQESTISTLISKAKEYATDDTLHNFKVAAQVERTTPTAALGGMMAKHTVSVYDMIHDSTQGISHPLALWEEKLKDSINYLYLLWALVNEKEEQTPCES